jgi:hypothetical protein
MGWLAGYSNRKKVTVTGTAVGAVTDYQLPLTVIGDIGVDAGATAHLDRIADPTLKDIRFTRSDGTTPLDYWIEINRQYGDMGITDFVGTIGFILDGAFYANGKTYIAYVAGAGADVNTIKILTYTHATGVFSAAVIVYAGVHVDNHDYPRPSVVVDHAGYIHVFYENNTQGTATQFYHRVSVNPYDIAVWADGNTPAGTDKTVYPNSLIDSAGNMYLVYCDADVSPLPNRIYISIRKSTDNGVTWTNPIAGYLVDPGNLVYTSPMAITIDANDRIHVAWAQAPRLTEDLFDVYYLCGESGGSVWKKADGTVIVTPASQATCDQVYDSAVATDETRANDIQLLPGTTHPWMLYAAQTAGSNMEWYLAKHDGANWSSVKIDEAGNSGDPDEGWGLIQVTDANTVTAYLTYGYLLITKRWITTNGGADWTEGEPIIGAGWGINRVCNGTTDFWAFLQAPSYTGGAYGSFSLSTVWVELNAVPIAPGTAEFYMYYGNPAAVDASSGAGTFILFDDFERGVNGDPVGGAWIVTNGSLIISTDHSVGRTLGRYNNSRSLKFVGAAAIPQGHIVKAAGTGYAIRTRYWHEDGVGDGPYFYHGNGTKIAITIIDLFESILYYDGASHDTGVDIVKDTWQLIEFLNFNWVAYTYDIVSNGIIAKVGATELVDAGANGLIRIQHTDAVAGEDIYIDDFLVRKYANPEPTYTDWDLPESPAAPYGNIPHKLVGAGMI